MVVVPLVLNSRNEKTSCICHRFSQTQIALYDVASRALKTNKHKNKQSYGQFIIASVFHSDCVASPFAASAISKTRKWTPGRALAAASRSRSNPHFIILQILDTCRRESVCALRQSQKERSTSKYTVCALLLIKCSLL